MKCRIRIPFVLASVLGVFMMIACENPGSESARPGAQVRDGAGGGNGIRSHGFIRVQGVPQRTITPPLIVS